MTENEPKITISDNFLQERFQELKAQGLLQKLDVENTQYEYYRYYTEPYNTDLITEQHETFAISEGKVVLSREKKTLAWSEDDKSQMVNWQIPGPLGVLEVKMSDEGAHDYDLFLDVIMYPKKNKKTSWGAGYQPCFSPNEETFACDSAGNNIHHNIVVLPNDPQYKEIDHNEDWFRNRLSPMRAGYVDGNQEFEVVFPKQLSTTTTAIKNILFNDQAIFDIWENPKNNPWNYFTNLFEVQIHKFDNP